jgi:hypothetical protein
MVYIHNYLMRCFTTNLISLYCFHPSQPVWFSPIGSNEISLIYILKGFSMPNYQDMEMKFGPALAYQYLTEIEKAARIPYGKIMALDPEARLANALRAQDLCESGAQLAA